jgi:hypothetical protein
MLARACAAGVRAAWVVGETIYGADELRTWLQTQQQPYVLAVAETHPVWVAGQAQPVGLVAALLPDEAWAPLAAGEGSQGPRLYRWAWLEGDAEPRARGGGRSWLLIRRSLSEPSKRAYYRVWGPPQTTLADLVRRAGQRWRIEAGLEEAKGEVGLDQYEVRTWTGWSRHITLALLAHAVLAHAILVVLVVLVVLRAQAQQEQETGALSTKGSGCVWPKRVDCCPPCRSRRSTTPNGCGGRVFAGGIRQAPNAITSSAGPGRLHAPARRGRRCGRRACRN